MFDDDIDSIVLYQPCGTSKCPTDFNCGNYTEAAVWVCQRQYMICDAYSTEMPKFSMLYEDPDEGIRLSAKSDKFTTETSVICDFELEEGKIFVNRAERRNKTLSLRVHAKAACMKPIETNVNGSCQAHLNDGRVSLDVDLLKYNRDQGISFKVHNNKWNSSLNHWMSIQPCRALPCPGDICPDSTGGTIWLCTDLLDGTTECLDYGLFRNLPSISPFASTLDRGISITYKGTDTRNTHIKVTCNESMEKGQIWFKSSIGIMAGDDLSVFASSADVCVPFPSPSPSKTPVPSTSPSPSATPIPYPWAPQRLSQRKEPVIPGKTEPSIAFYNDTHKNAFNINELFLDERKMKVVMNDKEADFTVEMHPFKQTLAPFESLPDRQYADVWGCWTPYGEKGIVCYAMMMGLTNGINYQSIDDLSAVIVSSDGYYDVRFDLTLECTSSDEFSIQENINFDGDRVFSMNVGSSKFCPVPESEPVFPGPPKDPTPSPAPFLYPIKFESDELN